MCCRLIYFCFICLSLRRADTQNSSDLDPNDETDELSLIDHEEIVARLTLKQEVKHTFALLAPTWNRAIHCCISDQTVASDLG